MQQPAAAALGGRLLGDQFGWKVEVEIGVEHGALF